MRWAWGARPAPRLVGGVPAAPAVSAQCVGLAGRPGGRRCRRPSLLFQLALDVFRCSLSGGWGAGRPALGFYAVAPLRSACTARTPTGGAGVPFLHRLAGAAGLSPWQPF